jgi:hypothetical protein
MTDEQRTAFKKAQDAVRLAHDPAATDAEREAAMAAARRLQERHNLSADCLIHSNRPSGLTDAEMEEIFETVTNLNYRSPLLDYLWELHRKGKNAP